MHVYSINLTCGPLKLDYNCRWMSRYDFKSTNSGQFESSRLFQTDRKLIFHTESLSLCQYHYRVN